MSKKAVIILGVVIALFVALAFYNNSFNDKPDNSTSEIWNENMIVGVAEAPHKIVEYGDYFCEFCTIFHEQVTSEKFKEKYLDTGKVRVETRPVTILDGTSQNTKTGVEAAFCAADQKKYDEYSHHIIPRIKKDYFDKGIGVKQVDGVMLAQPKKIEKLPQSYFDESAKAVDMDVDTFSNCVKEGKHAETIAKNTQKAIASGVHGLPHIIVNDRVSSGFAGGWDNFELMLKAGGIEG